MHTACAITGEYAEFALLDLDEPYARAAQALYVGEDGGRFVRRFPADGAGIERACATFSLHAETLLAQRAGLQPVPWQAALETFLRRVQ